MDLPESTSPRNAAERRVCFEKLENFGCGSLWESGLLSCSGTFAHVFFLCSTHHSSPLFFHFYNRSFGNSERNDIVSYYLPYSTLVFFRKRRGNFALNYFDFFFHFFENNCPFGKCKLSFFSALCRGRSNILCRVFSPLGLSPWQLPVRRVSCRITIRLAICAFCNSFLTAG